MRVLIVEDDADVAEVLGLAFAMQWAETETRIAPDGESALDTLATFTPAIIILDLALPDMDGLDVCRRIRQFSDVPIVMLTARDEERDIVRGLELGADDYVTKPFTHLHLFARIRAVLRRSQSTAPSGGALPLTFRDPLEPAGWEIVVDPRSHEVRRNGQRVDLTPTEYGLLHHLARNAGSVMRHETLLARVWGHDREGDAEYLKVFVRRLREKLEPDPHRPRFILTERGVGYRMVRPASAPGRSAV